MYRQFSPSPLAGLLGHSAERGVEAGDVVVPFAGVTQCHQVGVLKLAAYCAHWKAVGDTASSCTGRLWGIQLAHALAGCGGYS